MKKIILSLFVLANIASSNATEEGEKKPGASSGLGASVADMLPISLGNEGADPTAKQGITVEVDGEKKTGDDASSKEQGAGDSGKTAKDKESKRGCVIL